MEHTSAHILEREILLTPSGYSQMLFTFKGLFMMTYKCVYLRETVILCAITPVFNCLCGFWLVNHLQSIRQYYNLSTVALELMLYNLGFWSKMLLFYTKISPLLDEPALMSPAVIHALSKWSLDFSFLSSSTDHRIPYAEHQFISLHLVDISEVCLETYKIWQHTITSLYLSGHQGSIKTCKPVSQCKAYVLTGCTRNCIC